jgi:hypothetical protein
MKKILKKIRTQFRLLYSHSRFMADQEKMQNIMAEDMKLGDQKRVSERRP